LNRLKITPNYRLISIFSGLLITFQSRINAELSVQWGDSLEAAAISFATGLFFVSLITLCRADIKLGLNKIFKAVQGGRMAFWQCGAGAIGALFVAVQTYLVPIMGVSIFIVACLAGQMLVSLWIDHFGFAGGLKFIISSRRVVASFITLAAALVSAWDGLIISRYSILDILLAVFAGSWVGVQRALNGQINSFSKKSFATSQLNFITGFSFLTFLLILRSLFTDHSIMNLTSGPWWMFLGGSIGVFYIAFSAVAVQYVGVLEFTLLSVGGMLIGSLLLDVFVPSKGTHISPYLIAGIFLTYLGVIANGQSRFSRK